MPNQTNYLHNGLGSMMVIYNIVVNGVHMSDYAWVKYVCGGSAGPIKQ